MKPDKDFAENLANSFRAIARSAENEEELKIGVQQALTGALESLGIPNEVHFERNIYRSRRADALYPGVVIEYKRPGSLRSRPIFTKAVEELRDGLKGMSGREAIASRFIGVALDGNSIVFVRAKPLSSARSSGRAQTTLLGESIPLPVDLEIQGPLEVNTATVERLLLYLRQLTRRTLTPEALEEVFGPKRKLGSEVVGEVYRLFRQPQTARVQTLYMEWNRIFGVVYGKDLDRAQRDLRELVDLYGLPKEAELKEVLFSIQTYFALLMKMLAAEILSLRSGGLLSSFVRSWSVADDEQLRRELVRLESGGLFRDLGVRNFLEGDFFSWYLDVWDSRTAGVVRSVAARLGDFEPATTELEPLQATDLLKRLYQYLVPKSLRHDLGEYYTPDWLAESVLDAVGYSGDLGTRLLDPACGSGTFLVLAIRRVVTRTPAISDTESLPAVQTVLANIVGFDINPLAVLAARTNYLIALTPLRREALADIELPIYLADSVLTPESYPTLLERDVYQFKTTAENFRIHGRLAEKGVLERVMTALEESVDHGSNQETFLSRLEPLPVDSEDVRENLTALFKQMVRLEEKGKNRIWARILKNNAAPIYAGRFDFIVGNPPWIHWEDLSDDYRVATGDLWARLGLLSRKSGKAYVAQSVVDFATLFTYASLKYYLNEKGKLAFLISQTVFKSELGGRGFRQFMFPGTKQVFKVLEVDDLTSFMPFEDAANKTCFFVIQGGEATRYPVKYVRWELKEGSRVDDAKVGVDDTFDKAVLEARPSTPDPLSAWTTATNRAAKEHSQVYGVSPYKAKIGVDTLGANGVYWVEPLQSSPDGFVIIQNRPASGDNKDLVVRKSAIEAELVHPIVRGRDIRGRWRAHPTYAIVVPHDKAGGWRAIEEHTMSTRFPRTLTFLQSFKSTLANRPSYKDRRAKHPYYILFRVYPDSFSPYKVVWQRMTNEMKAAVVGPVALGPLPKGPVFPTDTVTFVSTKGPDEAHYICAVLNATMVRAAISAYASSGRGFGAPHILEHVRIPRYDPRNVIHKALAELSQEAHQEADNASRLSVVERKIDETALKLFRADKSSSITELG